MTDAAIEKLYRPRKNKDRYYTEFCDIIGESPAIKEVIGYVQQAARIDSNILIYGESGTGKELIARAIHYQGLRRSYSFVPINCGAIPNELLESELFGYEKGAFTGANKTRIGKLEEAESGTVFLDEISEIPLQLQVKLLRTTQEKEVCRVGSNQIRSVDFRIIVATNKDLLNMVKNGTFREDLYYRLNIIPIHIPPLRERLEDIICLANHFIHYHAKKAGKMVCGITDEAQKLLLNYHWPGNVRELQNVIEHAVSFTQEPLLTKEIFLKKINYKPMGKIDDLIEQADSLSKYVKLAEKRFLENKLEIYAKDMFAVERICQDIKISRATFYRKVKELGIQL